MKTSPAKTFAMLGNLALLVLLLCGQLSTASACDHDLGGLTGGQRAAAFAITLPSERTFALKAEGYVSLDLPFAPFEKLFGELNQARAAQGKLPLKSRGEAHLTVLTPPELTELKKALSDNDIMGFDALAREMGVAEGSLTLKGIGVSRRRITEGGKEVDAEAVYLMVTSDAVAAFREKVAELARRTPPGAIFDPAAYAPHITLGFTHRDLHVSDGVNKTQPDTVISVSGG